MTLFRRCAAGRVRQTWIKPELHNAGAAEANDSLDARFSPTVSLDAGIPNVDRTLTRFYAGVESHVIQAPVADALIAAAA